MKQEKSHFWIGNFKSEKNFFDFFGEDGNYYNDEQETDEKYISEFAKSQNENWIDHDFMECGYENDNADMNDKFFKYSYADQWLPILEKKISEQNIDIDINSIAFITKEKIQKPISIRNENFILFYVGEIEYEI
jgi:hypothetical protein